MSPQPPPNGPHDRAMTPSRLRAVASGLGAIDAQLERLRARWGELDDDSLQREFQLIERQVRSLQGLLAGADGERPSVLAPLTPRETQVLLLLAEGVSTAQTARSLGVSVATVRSHVKSVLAKLGVHSRIEAVALVRGELRAQ